MPLFEDMKGRARLMFNLESRDDSEAEEQKQVDRLEEISEYCPQLTFQQRLIGFAVSFSLGCKYKDHVFRFRTKTTMISCTDTILSLPNTAMLFLHRHDCFLLVPILHRLGRREPSSVRLQLYNGSCSSTAGVHISVRSKETIQKYV